MSRRAAKPQTPPADPTRTPDDQVDRPAPATVVHEILQSQAEALDDIRRMAEKTHELVARATAAPDFNVIELSAAMPFYRDDRGSSDAAQSIGLIVPEQVTAGTQPPVSLGFAGIGPALRQQGPYVEPGHFLILPVSAEDLIIAIDDPSIAAMDAADVVFVYLLRFAAAQPFSAGVL